MPKGKKGKKGKKGGKGKGSKKAKKDLSIKSMSEANSKLWESRLEVAERSRHEYRENARQLLLENDTLQNQVKQTEKDTIDVVTYLKRQDQDKDAQLEQMMKQVKDMKREHRNEKEQLIEDFQEQINELEQKLSDKSHEVDVMQSELKVVKEFRKKRSQMQKELDEIKEAMFAANREHKDALTRMEQKFFEEKMRLQQEANQKIAELAGRAHNEAIQNLDETTKSVYKENVRINEALNFHIMEGDKLKDIKGQLLEENKQLKEEKEMSDLLIQEKVTQGRKQKAQLKELQEKIETLENSLSHVVHEFETEQRSVTEKAIIENESTRTEMCKLQRTLDLRTREMNKVKKLAKNILDERTEIERFFLESLEQVKQEITLNRIHYRKDAQIAYQQKMIAAHSGKADFPKIRTFNKSENSTNSVFQDLEAAESLFEMSNKVDISELTWEQKEKVLRYMFAKMNGIGAQQHHLFAHPALGFDQHSRSPTIPNKTAWDDDIVDRTFLTQSQLNENVDFSRQKLPQIQPTVS